MDAFTLICTASLLLDFCQSFNPRTPNPTGTHVLQFSRVDMAQPSNPDCPSKGKQNPTSAGVFPVTRVHGRWHALLYNATAGNKSKALTDFGGRREFLEPSGLLAPPPPPSGRRPPTQTLESLESCAARELWEESGGLWGLGEILKPPINPKARASSQTPSGNTSNMAEAHVHKSLPAPGQSHLSETLEEGQSPHRPLATEDPMENLLESCEKAS